MPAEMPFFAVLGRDKVVLGELVATESPSESCGVYTGKPVQVRWPVLMRTIGDLNLISERVTPFASVSSAVRLMQEHGHRVVAVEENGQFRGIVTKETAALSAPDMPVREILETLVIEMPANTAVRTAARLFVENGLDCVPVLDNNKFLGLLTANQLLIELGRSWDPMTGLSWSDRLRDWGVDALESGREVTIVFFDLNDFGDYNKRHGHIIGDRILREFAQRLSTVAKLDRDVLVRYGGDEFVIGTVRPREEIEAELTSNVGLDLDIEGIPEPVTFSVGYAGGKRTRERERTHFASTLDNLINLASQDSMARKPGRTQDSANVATGQRPGATDRKVLVEVDWSGSVAKAVASVTLAGSTSLASGEAEAGDALGAAANAVCSALARIRPETTVTMDDVVVYRRWDGLPVAVVQATVGQRQGSIQVEASGSSDQGVSSALGEALILAMLKASEELGRKSGVSAE